ncbi:MAG TPA: TonB-dependent receptor [Methylomirabilota bacterium]|nr:TonB-dependent receptor [Methylomirabilota bacterium]
MNRINSNPPVNALSVALAPAALALALALMPVLADAADAIRPSKSDALENLTLEQLINYQVDSVFSASKYEQKVTQAPASVSIVTADEIKKFGWRGMGDLLRSVRGFYVSNDRSYSYLGSRGFQRPGDYNTRYLILVDGHPMNDNLYGAALVGNYDSFVDVDLIERVEIVRGPSSSIYGNSAFLGVINIVTKTGSQFNGGEASVEGGSFDTFKGRFSLGKKFANDIEWLVSGSYYTSEGQRKLYYPEFDQRISSNPRARNNGVVRDSDGEEAAQIYTSVAYHDFTLTGLYAFRNKDVPTASFGAFFGDTPLRNEDQRGYVELKYDRQFGETTELMGRVSYDAADHLGSFPYDYAGTGRPQDTVNDYDGSFGDWITTEWRLKQRVLDRHTMMVGVEYRENLHQELFNYDDLGTSFVDDERTSRSFAAYAQAEAVILTNLLLNAGLRYDHYDSFGGTLNPRLGLIYNPWEKTTFKLLYGQAFRAPNNYELYYSATAFGQVANPDLQPETIQTYEVIYEQYLPAHLRFSASAFFYEIDDLISQTLQPGTGLLIFDNVETVQSKGLGLELEGKYPGGLLARASYTVQRTDDADTGDEISNSPRHLVKANLSVPLYRDKVFAGLELQYQSSVGTLRGRRADEFVIGNFTLFSRELVKGLEASASIYNLFDTHYESLGSGGHLQDTIPQDGRSFRVKLTYKF